jgi:hypothetical protein
VRQRLRGETGDWHGFMKQYVIGQFCFCRYWGIEVLHWGVVEKMTGQGRIRNLWTQSHRGYPGHVL